MSDLSFEHLETIKEEQWKLFKKQLEYISENSPYYKRFFKEQSISIDEINSLDDIQKLPITSKEDLL